MAPPLLNDNHVFVVAARVVFWGAHRVRYVAATQAAPLRLGRDVDRSRGSPNASDFTHGSRRDGRGTLRSMD